LSIPIEVSRTALPVPAALKTLDRDGYVVIPHLVNQAAAEEYVRQIGDLIPQYNGSVVHQVTYRPGNDGRAYSQSTNSILAHTEAPGWNPSPAYLALFCHRQAQCGGGHTDMLDYSIVMDALGPDERAMLTDRPIFFPGPDGGLTTTMLSTDDTGRTVLRFSYNLLTYADYDPTLDVEVDPARLPLGAVGRALAAKVSDLFLALRTRVLIPENALLIWDNQRMLHARSQYRDKARHLTRFWCADRRRA
jgi:hypothetical protein